MKTGLIITLPRSDLVTEYLSQFSEEIIKEAEVREVKCKPLKDEDANKEEFEKVLRRLDYNFVVFNGHGTQDTIKGNANEVLIKLGQNEIILNNRIIYARACEAGEDLGKVYESSEEGCFIGYCLKFEFWADKTWDSVPLKDEKARLFLEPSNMVPISLLKGHSGQEAHDIAKKYTLKSIRRVLKNPSEDSFWLISSLWKNYYSQTIYGNRGAKI